MSEELELTMELFKEAFASTWAQESEYLGVLVDIYGSKEVIINHKRNYEEKLEYYKETYDEKLKHKYAGIQIIDFTFADNYAEIEDNLVDTYKQT